MNLICKTVNFTLKHTYFTYKILTFTFRYELSQITMLSTMSS